MMTERERAAQYGGRNSALPEATTVFPRTRLDVTVAIREKWFAFMNTQKQQLGNRVFLGVRYYTVLNAFHQASGSLQTEECPIGIYARDPQHFTQICNAFRTLHLRWRFLRIRRGGERKRSSVYYYFDHPDERAKRARAMCTEY